MYKQDVMLPEIQEQMREQAKVADIAPQNERVCSNEERVNCATLYGASAVENKILVSISENINTMAEAIKNSERQKQNERKNYVCFFKCILVFLVSLITALIIAGTFFGVYIRIEFLVSVILAIIADVFAIIHTLVKYMTNVENYEAYSKLIDSLLRHINHEQIK